MKWETFYLWALPIPALWLLWWSIRRYPGTRFSRHQDEDFEAGMTSSNLAVVGCTTAVTLWLAWGFLLLFALRPPE